MEANASKRLLRFRLRTLLVLVTLVAIWLGWNVNQLRKRDQMLRYLTSQGAVIQKGGPTKPWKSMPFAWSLLGAEPVSAIQLPNHKFSDVDLPHIETWFPEADIQWIGGTGGMF